MIAPYHTTTLIVVAVIVHSSPSLQMENDQITLRVPPLLSSTTSKRIIVPPTLPPWLRAHAKSNTHPGHTTKPPIIIQPPTLRPASQSSSSAQAKLQPSSLPSSPYLPTSRPHSRPSTPSNLVIDETANLDLGHKPVSEKTSARMTSTMKPSGLPPSNPHGFSHVLDTVEQSLLSSLQLSLGVGDHGPKPTGGLICYDDRPGTIEVPCPRGSDGPPKEDITLQHLTVMLRDQGGNILKEYATLEPPDHLKGFNLSDIENSDWMNLNNTYLGYNIQRGLKLQEKRVREMMKKMKDVIATGSLRSITSMAKTLLSTLMSTPTFDICYTNLHEGVVNDSLVLNESRACLELFRITENLVSINLQIQDFSSGESSDNVYFSRSGDLNLDNAVVDMLRSSNMSDKDIDEMYKRLEDLSKASFKMSDLNGKLHSAIASFKDIVSGLQKTFLDALQDLELELYSNSNLTIETGLTGFMGESREDKSNTTKQISPDKTAADVSKADPPGIKLFPDTVTANSSLPDSTTSPQGQGNASKAKEMLSVKAESDNSMKSANLSQKSDVPRTVSSDVEKGDKTTETSLANILRLNDTAHGVDLVEDNSNISSTKEALLKEKLLISEFFSSLTLELEKLNHLIGPENSSVVEKDEHFDNLTAMYRLKRRTKRDLMGFNIAHDKCQYQGVPVNGSNYLSLCSSCIHTTVLDNSFFPRYLTERICIDGTSKYKSLSKACLRVPTSREGARDQAGGVCQHQEFHIILLRREPGKCMKIGPPGHEIVTDKWKPVTYPLRIGCQCLVDENSQFAKYATFP